MKAPYSIISLFLLLVLCSCKETVADIPIPIIPVKPPVVVPVDTLKLVTGDGVYYTVKARDNATVTTWKSYTAKTVDHLKGFSYGKDPEVDSYGGYKVNQSTATGFFRVEKKGNRWWLVDPDGYPFIHRGVACFVAGTSSGQKSALTAKYGSSSNWVNTESDYLRQKGMNGTGAWSDVELIRGSAKPLVYTVIVNPMASYRAVHIQKYGGSYPAGSYGWQGYYHDIVMVFDPEFDTYVDSSIKGITKYASDKNLLGYFTDNELPWIDKALYNHIYYLTSTEAGFIAAVKWLDARRGTTTDITPISDKTSTAFKNYVASITTAEQSAFTGYYFETYAKKVSAVIKKYDPNHLYLGCRFNQSADELDNPEIFKMAGQYLDVISINHYRKWEPDQTIMANWESWSSKPFLISEWYTKGEDSGLPNNTGAGWNVPTQVDRGYFYQNFALGLIQSKACVGWHWFTYQDNDPLNLNTDPSNRDSNKGIVNSNFEPWTPLIDNMKKLNDHVYELTQFFDK
jgi:hypothetical protein